MKINRNTNTEIWIMDVDRGLSVLMKTPQNYGMIYDFGSGEDYSPVGYYSEKNLFDGFEEYSELNQEPKKIAQCVISRLCSDNVSDLNSANTAFINENCFNVICRNDITEGSGENDNAPYQINNCRSLYSDRKVPLSSLIHEKETDLADFRIGFYYLTHKQAAELFSDDKEAYSRSLSIVFYLAHGNNSILIPGDITPEALKFIIDGKCEKRFTDYLSDQCDHEKTEWAKTTSDQPDLRSLLEKGLTVLIAPQHGSESGYSDYLFQVMCNGKADIIITSHKRPFSQYAGVSCGITYNDEPRYFLNTFTDGHIKVTFSNASCVVKASEEIDDLFV
ncbi:MAG: hypothetical protein JW864_16700 [Spirochaetes bacterium]|nr:hypothetical protein [Spirochaetota bacterium]